MSVKKLVIWDTRSKINGFVGVTHSCNFVATHKIQRRGQAECRKEKAYKKSPREDVWRWYPGQITIHGKGKEKQD